MEWAKWAVQPAVMVLEILFMISPFALYFYAAYGPTLNVLHASAWTAWLTQFFLPHVAHTHSVVLDAVPVVAGILVVGGALIFLAGAVPLYWAKLRRRRLVTGGAYAVVRHPRYVGLAVIGLGTLLIWPRFLAALTYVVLIHALPLVIILRYGVDVREEAYLKRRFGDAYRDYQARVRRWL